MTFPPKFVWGWPSWLVEWLGALLLVASICWLPWAPLRWLWELGLSELYEAKFDRNGYEQTDVEERAAWTVALEAVVIFALHHGRLL